MGFNLKSNAVLYSGGGFSGMLRGLQGWTRVNDQVQPFQGQARTIEGEIS